MRCERTTQAEDRFSAPGPASLATPDAHRRTPSLEEQSGAF